MQNKRIKRSSLASIAVATFLMGPIMNIDLVAAPTTQTTAQTWSNGKRETITTGSKYSGQVIKENLITQSSNLGNTRKIRTGYEVYKYDFNQKLSSSEIWKYNVSGIATEKNITTYVPGTSRYDNQKTYKWATPGSGSSYLSKESYYNRSNYDINRKEYNSKRQLIKETLVGKNNSSKKESTYTRKADGKITKAVTTNYNLQDDDLSLRSRETKTYYANNKVKDVSTDIYENQYSTSLEKKKNIYNSYYDNGKRKVARDTYFEDYSNGKLKASIRENNYDSKGIKTKSKNTAFWNGNIDSTKETYYYSNGKRKISRDTYYSDAIKMKLSETHYNTKGTRTKNVYNEWDNTKPVLYRDTYYYANGNTKKEVKESKFFNGVKNSTSLSQFYSNGKPKLSKDTEYYDNGRISSVEQTSYNSKGKSKYSYKRY